MNIIAVDDERLALRALEEVVLALYPDCTLACFTSPSKALAHAAGQQVDVALLDIEMGGMTGLALAERLMALYRHTNIIFTTGYSEYALPAFSLAPSGYLLKPVTAAALEKEMARLRHPVAQAERRVRIQTFGHFELFINEKPLLFSRARSKEVLAYLVDRKGAGITRKELAAILWGDRAYTRNVQTHLQILITDLLRTLEEAGISHIVIRRHGHYAIDAAAVDCDFYSFSKGSTDAGNAYGGEYMTNYSWAEYTQGMLDEKQRHLDRRGSTP